MVTGEVRQLNARRATLPTDMPTGFESALAQVTGRAVELRDAAAPAQGWLNLVDPGQGGWLSFSAFGSSLFSVDINVGAVQAWATAIGTVEEIIPEIAAGTYGLMDLRRLHDAETLVRSLSGTLSQAVDDLKAVVTPLEGEGSAIAGSAAAALLDHLHLIGTVMASVEADLTEPSPAVADILGEAATALTTFGQKMSSAYAESRPLLVDAMTIGGDAIVQNVIAYLTNAGLLPNSQQYQALAPDPAAGLAYAKLVLSRYSSAASGRLPNGMTPFGGDLSQPAVWAAASAAITQLITTELEKLDTVARTATGELAAAYDKATARLNAGGPGTRTAARTLQRGQLLRQEAPMAPLEPRQAGERQQLVAQEDRMAPLQPQQAGEPRQRVEAKVLPAEPLQAGELHQRVAVEAQPAEPLQAGELRQRVAKVEPAEPLQAGELRQRDAVEAQPAEPLQALERRRLVSQEEQQAPLLESQPAVERRQLVRQEDRTAPLQPTETA